MSTKILKRRPKKGYASFGAFLLKNIDILNKKIVESYAKAGAFASFTNKDSILSSVDNILEFISLHKGLSEYYSIFDIAKINVAGYIDQHKINQSDKEDDLKYEIETLGLYITKHPMESYIVNDRMKTIQVGNVENYHDGARIITAGAICSIDIRKTKAKTNMASFDLTDATRSVKCIVFPKVFAQFQDAMEEGKIVAVRGVVKEEDETLMLSVNEIIDDPKELAKYLCPIQRRDDSLTTVRWHRDIASIKKLERAGLIVNSGLSFILERI